MIDIEHLRRDPDAVTANLARRGVSAQTVTAVAELDSRWRALQQATDELRAAQNQANDKIAAAEGDAKKKLIADMRAVSSDLKAKNQELAELSRDREQAWRLLPNLVDESVPLGGEEASVVVAESSIVPVKDESRHSYLELLGDSVDLERAAKVAGSRFSYLLGDVARLEFALVSFALDQLREAGFVPVIPPVLLNEQAMRGMGYLDHEGDEIYKTQDDLYLVGTSEQSLGAMHMNEILSAADLPRRYVGFSTCFRREAGSHGKDVRGILRVHQFDKVEMFSIVAPTESAKEHEFILGQQRALMDALELPYRVMNMASGDLGAPAAKKYDIETWIPSEGVFRETHSTSNTTDYQARRLNIRTKVDGETVPVHMLNGTAFAIGRILIALAENHQQPDGSIRIPKVLHSYLPFTEIKK
jgi:seryl-tRNA synthetase